MSELNFSEEQLMETAKRIVFGHQGEMVLAARDLKDPRARMTAMMDTLPNTEIQPISVASRVLFEHMRFGPYAALLELVKLWCEEEGVPLENLDGFSPCQVVEHYVQQLAHGFSMIVTELVRQAREQGVDLATPLATIMSYRRPEITLNDGGLVGRWLPSHPFPPGDPDDGSSVPVSC